MDVSASNASKGLRVQIRISSAHIRGGGVELEDKPWLLAIEGQGPRRGKGALRAAGSLLLCVWV